MSPVVVTTTFRPDGASDFGDVRVVDAPAGNGVARRGPHHRQAVAWRQVVHGHSREHFLLAATRGHPTARTLNSGGSRVATEKNSRQQCHAVAGAVTRFSATSCRIVCAGAALRAEIDESGQQHARVEKDAHGQRFALPR